MVKNRTLKHKKRSDFGNRSLVEVVGFEPTAFWSRTKRAKSNGILKNIGISRLFGICGGVNNQRKSGFDP